MTVTMTPCSTVILTEKKAYCRSCTYSIEVFINAFARKFYEKMVAFIQSMNLEIY